MSSAKRDTESCVYIRFQVNENRIESFRRMFLNATKNDFNHLLSGVAKDSGSLHLTFAFPATGFTGQQGAKKYGSILNTVFVKLFDFYPSFSEKPSEIQTLSAKNLLRALDANALSETVNNNQPKTLVHN